MRATVAWSDKIADRDGVPSICYSLAYRPDGSQLIAAVGNRVLIYDAEDGELLKSLKGHKEAVYAVAYSADGKRFASGGAECLVIIWTSKAEGILKYSHNDSIQALAYNPVTQQLASATATDIGSWSPDQKSVAKHKVNSKVLCVAWTGTGQYLALGHFSGDVIILDKVGQEKASIQRDGPVWSIAWSRPTNGSGDVLAVGAWDGTLSYYTYNGNSKTMSEGKEVSLKYNPCSVSYFSNERYMLIGGTNKKVFLSTPSGVKLTTVAERDNWVWSAAARPNHNFVAVGCQDGSIAVYQLSFSTVHGLYQSRYAYREHMTDVVVQHLITDQKIRIKCRDYIKKIAIYKDKLAVQLPEKVVIYEPTSDDNDDIEYKVTCQIARKLDCNLLVVTSMHVILCQERKLQLLSFDGEKEREWVLESVIRYIKVVGGPGGREGLLVGLKNGHIFKIFIDNSFPIPLIQHDTAIRCLDVSASRTKLAIVDENTAVLVYDLKTKVLLFQDTNANSVAWNTDLEDMFCFSGNGQLSIKTGDFPLHRQKLQGFVVGFKSSKVFCLHYVSMQTIDVPQSESLYRYINIGQFEDAYKVACLGVTQSDWRLLAMESLKAMSLNIARKAFIQVRDVRYIDILNRIEEGRKRGIDERLFLSEINAFQGRYQEAARMYAKCGHAGKAMEMFSDLRQFEEAKRWAEDMQHGNLKVDDSALGTNVQQLMQKQAEWSEEVNDFKAAADMYLKANKYGKAISLLAKGKHQEKLAEVVRMLPKSEEKYLHQCASHLVKFGAIKYAKEAFQKLGDFDTLIKLYVDNRQWDDAFAVLNSHPRYGEAVYFPYAQSLADNDQFDEARLAYRKAGRPEESIRMLEQLTNNAILERRFDDAGHFFWVLAIEHLALVTNTKDSLTQEDDENLAKFRLLFAKAEVYFAYHSIYRAIEDPFHSIYPGTVFNISRYLVMRLQEFKAGPPQGISLLYIFFAMAKYGEQLGAFKLARHAYSRLVAMRVPTIWMEQIDLSTLLIRSKPFSDKEDLLPVCYRCSTINPLLNSNGDVCISHNEKFHRSFLTFEHLPVVQFYLEEGISDEEAIELILRDPAQKKRAPAGASTQNSPTVNMLTLDDSLLNDSRGRDQNDSWTKQLGDIQSPIYVDKQFLRDIHHSEVIVRRWPSPALPTEYFRLIDPELPLVVGPSGHFFEMEDYEMFCLEKERAPLCGTPLSELGNGTPWEINDASYKALKKRFDECKAYVSKVSEMGRSQNGVVRQESGRRPAPLARQGRPQTPSL